MKTKAELEKITDFKEINNELFFDWDKLEKYPAKVYYSKSENIYKSVNEKTGTEYWTAKKLDAATKERISDYTGFPESDITPADIFVANEIEKIKFSDGGLLGGSGDNDYFPLL